MSGEGGTTASSRCSGSATSTCEYVGADKEEYPLCIVQQWLHESGYKNTLAALEAECGMKYDASKLRMGSELISNIVKQKEFEAASAAEGTAADGITMEENRLLNAPADGEYVKGDPKTISLFGGVNLLTVKFHPSADSTLLATSSNDRALFIVDWARSEVVRKYICPGAAVSLDWNPVRHNILAVSTLAHTHHIFDVSLETEEPIQSFEVHTKYAVAIKWSKDGNYLATGGYDKTIHLFNGTDYHPLHTWTFSTAVEALIFNNESTKIIAAVRENNYLHVLDLTSFETTYVNVNATGDDHVSFSIMDLCLSSSNLLLASTDRSRVILFRSESSTQLRNYYGAQNDEYSQPRCLWGGNTLYLYGTSQDNTVYVWEVGSQKCVHKLTGHNKKIRSMDYTTNHNMLATASFDGTLKLWSMSH
ncbi:Protein will die slowly [Pelomyxa schiedti]|nr:Protein will die slowly [Pelomyxa schiedti]